MPSRAALAPDFILPEADGNTFALNRQKGKVVLLSFWASYCKPCIAEMPLLENLWATYRDSGLAVAGISIDTKRSQAKAKEIAVKQRVSYPILYDLGQKAMTLYKVKDVPATFLIDKRGNIRYHCEGFTEKTKEELIDKIKLLLAELKAPPVIYFAGIECKGKAAGLKQQADSLLLAGIPEKYKKITFETGSPGEADYCLSGAMVQMGQVIGIDLALKSNLKDEKPLAQVAATGQVAEALDKLKGLVNEILSNIK
ncbi:MAG: TlpA disulfide reductase family protein [bacterium]|nr:TlpA disulfide reductase family protein [bacterium]